MEARNFSSDWDYQDALHGADILESAAGEDFIREEEEALLTSGCSQLVETESFWAALHHCPLQASFTAIKRWAIDHIMDGEKFRQAAREHLEAEAQQRMEP